MNIKVYNQQGEAIGEQELNPKLFDIAINEGLVHRAAVAQLANRRKVLAHTKDRGEVRGGGKKPWAQKGTGRARHGSIRSPIWKGGGVTFGPTKDRNFKLKINKKMRRKALLICLSDKARGEKIVLVDQLELTQPKTKELKKILEQLPVKGKKILLAFNKSNKNFLQAGKNLEKLWVTTVNSLNVLDLLNYEYLMMPLAGLEELEKVFLKEKIGYLNRKTEKPKNRRTEKLRTTN